MKIELTPATNNLETRQRELFLRESFILESTVDSSMLHLVVSFAYSVSIDGRLWGIF